MYPSARCVLPLAALLLVGPTFAAQPGAGEPLTPAERALTKATEERGGSVFIQTDPGTNQVLRVDATVDRGASSLLKDLPQLLKPFADLRDVHISVPELTAADLPTVQLLTGLPAFTGLTIVTPGKPPKEGAPIPVRPTGCRLTFHRDATRKAIVACSFNLGADTPLTVKDIAALLKPFPDLETISLSAAHLGPDDLQYLQQLLQFPKLKRLRVVHTSLPPAEVARWKAKLSSTARTRFALLDERRTPESWIKELLAPIQLAPGDDALRRLQLRRCQLAADLFTIRLEKYRTGRPEGTADQLVVVGGEFLLAYLALNAPPKDKLAWLERYRDLLDYVEEIADRRERAGKNGPGEMLRVQLLVVDADLVLEQARRGANPKPDK